MSIKIKDGELFIGIISTVGVNTSLVIESLQNCLTKFNYFVETINVSSDIIAEFEKMKYDGKSEYERITHYMDLGNQIRMETNDNAILMKGVSREIFKRRERDENRNAQPRSRVAYIIKSIKHSDEVEYLRDTYGCILFDWSTK